MDTIASWFQLVVCLHRTTMIPPGWCNTSIILKPTAGSPGGQQLNVMPPVRPVTWPVHGFILLCSAKLKISPNTRERFSPRLGITWPSLLPFEIEMLRSSVKACRCSEPRQGMHSGEYKTGPVTARKMEWELHRGEMTRTERKRMREGEQGWKLKSRP